MLLFKKRINAFSVFCVKQRAFLSAHGEKFFQRTTLATRYKMAASLVPTARQLVKGGTVLRLVFSFS